jgi:acetyl-CoA C-acetyltransferase
VVDPRAPVVVGVAQLTQRPDDVGDAREAVALMTDVVRSAADDAGSGRLLAALDLVVAVNGAWSYRDPARLVADAVGATSARTVRTADGGNMPQVALDLVADRIASGALDVGVVVGAETIWSRRRLQKAGIDRQVTRQPDDLSADEMLGTPLDLDPEDARGDAVRMPVETYPLFESALRTRRGESLDDHRDRIAAMWERFNTRAVANPYAWSRTPMTAAEIRDAGRGNRMVAFPYTKAMCSNWDLDQAAAVLVCSAEAADRFGVPRERWVFLHAGAEADDTPRVSHRRELGRSPAIAAAWQALTGHTDTGIDDIAHLDVYSCFPSAVQAACEAIGIDEQRELTVTGGLTFAGGPLNNYVSHSVAAMVDVLRADPDALGLVTANGGMLTKHALGLYSTRPPARPFRRLRVDDVRHQARDLAAGHVGPVTIEASTVMHDHDGPSKALFAALTADGRRTWGSSADRDVMTAAMTRELNGTPADVDEKGRLHL